MFSYPIQYDQPLFRPPAESASVIFQITIGCSWNKCKFCDMYKQKKYRQRELAEVLDEIKRMAEYFPQARKIFLGDGNALQADPDYIIEILKHINQYFPRLTRISAYALPGDILKTSEEQLKAYHDLNLKLIYVGLESGDDELLERVKKSETFETSRKALLKAKDCGLESSVMILNGLGGRKFMKQHAINSARLVNEVQPKFLSTLVLSFPLGKDNYIKRFGDDYQEMTALELLCEMYEFIKHTELDATIFRSNHVSNFMPLKGTLGKDKERLMKEMEQGIEYLKNNPYELDNEYGSL